jgi:hypothetical protein
MESPGSTSDGDRGELQRACQRLEDRQRRASSGSSVRVGARFTPRLDERLMVIAADGKIQWYGFTPPLQERATGAVTPIRDRRCHARRRGRPAGALRVVRGLARDAQRYMNAS